MVSRFLETVAAGTFPKVISVEANVWLVMFIQHSRIVEWKRARELTSNSGDIFTRSTDCADQRLVVPSKTRRQVNASLQICITISIPVGKQDQGGF